MLAGALARGMYRAGRSRGFHVNNTRILSWVVLALVLGQDEPKWTGQLHVPAHLTSSYARADVMFKRVSIDAGQGTQGNRAAADRSRPTGWSWPGGGSGAGPVDPGDYDTVEANASMAMLPAIPCRQVGRFFVLSFHPFVFTCGRICFSSNLSSVVGLDCFQPDYLCTSG